MEKYDFEKMGGIWKDEARTITENGVFVANSGNWDLWEYSWTVYSIPVSGSGCGASVWCPVAGLRGSSPHARYADILGLFRILGSMSIIIFWAVLGSPKLSARSGIQSGSRQQARA